MSLVSPLTDWALPWVMPDLPLIVFGHDLHLYREWPLREDDAINEDNQAIRARCPLSGLVPAKPSTDAKVSVFGDDDPLAFLLRKQRAIRMQPPVDHVVRLVFPPVQAIRDT